MSQTIPPPACPQCGRPDLRLLTWRSCGSDLTSYGCWDCDWITYPPGITATNWQPLLLLTPVITRLTHLAHQADDNADRHYHSAQHTEGYGHRMLAAGFKKSLEALRTIIPA